MIEFRIFLLCFALGACSRKANSPLATSPEVSSSTGVPTRKISVQPVGLSADSPETAIVGHCDMPLTKAQPECSLGNFLADAMLAAGQKCDEQVSVAVSNYGALRMDYLPPGPITRAQVKALMPFDNKLVVLEMPGKQLQELCDHIASRKGWPVAGLSFQIRNGKAENVKIKGQSLNKLFVYKVVVNSYLAKGPEGCEFLSGLESKVCPVTMRSALLSFLAGLEQNGQVLHPAIGKRIVYAD